MTKILFDEQPIVVDKVLARKIGLNEAIVLQQVHYWLKVNEKKNLHYINGRYWTYNTLKEWRENNFDFWSLDTVKRAFTKLEKLGILLVGNFNQDRRDRTKWYTIDYDKLEESIPPRESNNVEKSKSANCTNATDDSSLYCKSAICANATVQDAPLQKCNMHRPLPETNYTEITNRDYNQSIHPSTDRDNITLADEPDDQSTDGWTDGLPGVMRIPDQNSVRHETSQASKVIKQLCENTGASINQVREAVRRANQLEKEGKLKGNYLKLVESIARTVIQEDLVKNSGLDDYGGTRQNTKKDLIKSLYRS